MKLLLSGEFIDAQTALAAGLASEVTAAEETVARAIGLARTIAGKGPVAVRHAKEAVLKANGVGIGKLLDCELTTVRDEDRMTLAYARSVWSVEHFRHADHIAALACSSVAARWHVLEAIR